MLIHIEVQGQRDADFARRMFVYAYRLFDRYAREIVSLAVLADPTPGWRPRRFAVGRWGSRLGLTFPSVKLTDYYRCDLCDRGGFENAVSELCRAPR